MIKLTVFMLFLHQKKCFDTENIFNFKLCYFDKVYIFVYWFLWNFLIDISISIIVNFK